jgi:hypothetical protein
MLVTVRRPPGFGPLLSVTIAAVFSNDSTPTGLVELVPSSSPMVLLIIALNSFPAIRVLARIFYAYFLLVKKKIFKEKIMTIFSILKVDDGYTLKNYPSVG